jgi:tetratricopeptide (TPR) repeat protein
MGQRTMALAPHGQSLLIKITQGPHKGESFNTTKLPFTIGRNADNDIVLPNDSKISRNHVTVSKREYTYVVENLSQRNPILLNLEERSKIELYPGQKFQIGESELEFHWDDPVAKELATAKELAAIKELAAAKEQAAAKSISPIVNPVQQRPQSAKNHNSNPVNPHDLVIPKNVTSVPVISGNKKINITINQSYEQPPTGATKKKARRIKPKNNSFLIIIIVGVALVLFMIPKKDGTRTVKKNNLRSTEEIQKALESSRVNIENYQKEKRIQDDGSIDKQFESSQSYYIRGFRDYRNGQFSRSIQAFQAALSFDPNHILSRKYLNLSLKKLDELIQFNISQGRRYREKGNFRFCKSAFQQVMIIKKDPNDPVFKEAKQLFDECETLHKGRY